MKKHIAVALGGLLGLSVLGCEVSSRAVVLSDGTSLKETGRDERQPQQYRDVSVAVWEADSKGTKVEARLMTLNAPLKDAPAELPLSRLTIKNLAAGKVIHECDVDDRPLSMYTHDLNSDGFPELVLTWNKGAVAERLEIFSVNAAQARVLLNEAYRSSATFMHLDDKTVDVLITTSDSGVGPLYTTRYTWGGDRYEAAGKASYNSLVSAIKKRFSEPQKSRAVRSR